MTAHGMSNAFVPVPMLDGSAIVALIARADDLVSGGSRTV